MAATTGTPWGNRLPPNRPNSRRQNPSRSSIGPHPFRTRVPHTTRLGVSHSHWFRIADVRNRSIVVPVMRQMLGDQGTVRQWLTNCERPDDAQTTQAIRPVPTTRTSTAQRPVSAVSRWYPKNAAAWRWRSSTAEKCWLRTVSNCRNWSVSSPQRFSSSPAWDRSTPPKSSCPGPTLDGAATMLRSPHWPGPVPSRPVAGRPSATGSIAAGTASSTERCTTSPSPGGAAAPKPTPTSPNDDPKAKRTGKSAAA